MGSLFGKELSWTWAFLAQLRSDILDVLLKNGGGGQSVSEAVRRRPDCRERARGVTP